MPSAKRCRSKSLLLGDIFVQHGIKSASGLTAGVQIETSEGAGFLANLANCEEMYLLPSRTVIQLSVQRLCLQARFLSGASCCNPVHYFAKLAGKASVSSVPKVGSHTDHLLHVSFSPTSRIELKRQDNLRAIKQKDRNILVTIRSNSCHDFFVRVQLVTREPQTDTSVATCLQKCIQSHHCVRSRRCIPFP